MMKLILYFAVTCCVLNNIVGQLADKHDIHLMINDQSDLEQLWKNETAISETIMPLPYDNPRNITIRMAANNYTFDIPEFLHVLNLTNGDTLTMEGLTEGSAPGAATSAATNISCVHYNTSSNDDRSILKNASFADVSKIVYSGLSFTGCQAPLRIENVLTVIVENCIFKDNQHGALNIFNSPNITVKNCVFSNNTSDGLLTNTPFRASSGGLSISYNSKKIKEMFINIFVSNCTFTNNVASLDLSLRYSINRLFSENLYSGRGGGLAIIFNTTSRTNCTVIDCTFINNTARSLSGGLYTVIGEARYDQTYLFKNNMFSGNSAMLSGAFNFVVLTSRNATTQVNASIHNCTFQHNSANIAGSTIVYFYDGLARFSVMFEECKFINNTASLYAGVIDVVSYNFFAFRNMYQLVEFINCTFEGNSGSGGAAINLAYYNARFDNVNFTNNIGSTLRVTAGKVHFKNQVMFINNNARKSAGGALYLLSFSQLRLVNSTNLTFINNTGRLGAAVAVETGNFSLNMFNHIYFNPLCFLQYYSAVTAPSNLSHTSVYFNNNKAVVGSDIYADKLDLCSWYSYDVPHFHSDAKEILRWPFIKYSEIIDDEIDQRNISYNMSLPIQTPAVNFSFANSIVSAYPGETIKLKVVPVDEQDFITTDIIQMKNSPFKNGLYFAFSPSAIAVEPPSLDYEVSYKIKMSHSNAVTNIANKSFDIQANAPEFPFHLHNMSLTIMPCPPGQTFKVTDVTNEYNCQCDDDNDQNIVECLTDDRKLIIEEGLWAHYVDVGTLNGILECYQCPPSYCQCTRVDSGSNVCNSVYYYDNDDLQCVCDRKGYLCGQCRGDKGVSALLNNCVTCGYFNILLIIALDGSNRLIKMKASIDALPSKNQVLLIIDSVVITVILLSSITLPSWLYPLLFYIQITPYVAQYFPVTFSAVQPYLHYISSAVSLYFPYDFCLYPGMTALASYSFRYIPIILLTIIFTAIWIINRKFNAIRLRWGGLWLLIMLTFTDVIYTSVSILNCPTLMTGSRKETPRWFVDGTVECFTGGHAALAVFAMLVLVLCFALVIIITAIVVRKLKRSWTFSFEKILKESFADEYNWWSSIELIRRIIFISLTLLFYRNLAPVVLCSMIYTAIYSYVQPYKSWRTNILESVLLIDLLLMLAVSSTAHFKQSVLNSEHSFSIDHCGQVDTISEHAAMLIPFYYFPLIILFVIIACKIILSIKDIVAPYIKRGNLRHFSIARRPRSTCIIYKPTDKSFELRINTLKNLSIRLIEESSSH